MEIKIGDVVHANGSEIPKMVVGAISDKKATCQYYNEITGLFTWVELRLEMHKQG